MESTIHRQVSSIASAPLESSIPSSTSNNNIANGSNFVTTVLSVILCTVLFFVAIMAGICIKYHREVKTYFLGTKEERRKLLNPS